MIAVKHTILNCSIVSWFAYYVSSGALVFLYLNIALAAFVVVLGCTSGPKIGKDNRIQFLSLLLLVATLCFMSAVKSAMAGTIDLGVVTISLNLLCGSLVAFRLIPVPSFHLPVLAMVVPVTICFITGSTLNELFPHSTNHISIYYLAALSLLFIEREPNSFRNMLLVLGVGLLLFFQDGRSNTLVGTLLIACSLLQLWMRLRIGTKLIARPGVLLFLAAGAATLMAPALIAFLAESEARFNKDILQGPRMEILRAYTDSMTPLEIVIGRSAGWSNDILDLSIHNSYLAIHQSTGMFLLFFVFLFARQIPLTFDSKTFLKGAVICVILLRASTDSFLLDWGVVFGYLIFSRPISRKADTRVSVANQGVLGV